MSSGSEVVGAATMPPVASKLRPFSVIRERRTAALHSPTSPQLPDQPRQNFSVSARAALALKGRGTGRCEGPWVRTKEWLSPAAMVKSATERRSLPRIGTVPLSASRWGPAMAVSTPPAPLLTQGTVMP